MNTMEKYEKRLDEEQWGELYNKEQAEQVINGILTEQVFCWTEELLKISAEGDKLCEVGCGSGQSAAYLQKHGRKGFLKGMCGTGQRGKQPLKSWNERGLFRCDKAASVCRKRI